MSTARCQGSEIRSRLKNSTSTSLIPSLSISNKPLAPWILKILYLYNYNVKPISNTLWQLGQIKSHLVVLPSFLKMLWKPSLYPHSGQSLNSSLNSICFTSRFIFYSRKFFLISHPSTIFRTYGAGREHRVFNFFILSVEWSERINHTPFGQGVYFDTFWSKPLTWPLESLNPWTRTRGRQASNPFPYDIFLKRDLIFGDSCQ